MQITVDTSKTQFITYNVRSNTLSIPAGSTDSDNIGSYPIKIKLLDSVDKMETKYSLTLLIVEPELRQVLSCPDTEISCTKVIDESGTEIEICECSEETSDSEPVDESCEEDAKVCSVEMDDHGDYIDVCFCPDAAEVASSECEELELVCELVGPTGEEKEVCSCPKAQECSPEELECTQEESGEESCVCNSA